MSTALFCLGWIVCGVLAYGLGKNNWKEFYARFKLIGYGSDTEILVCCHAALGYLGLFLILLYCSRDTRWGFCFKMPKDLTRKARDDEWEARLRRIREARTTGEIREVLSEIHEEVEQLKK